jgi:hypothetical protein
MAASVDVPRRSSEFGSTRSGWGPQGQLVNNSMPVTNNAVDAVITTPAAQATAISIQLNNADGSAIAHRQVIDVCVYADAGAAALAATGGSTGIAIGANGIIEATVVSKKVFRCRTDAAGLLKLTWTDNAAEAAFLGVVLPNGRTVMSTALPTA